MVLTERQQKDLHAGIYEYLLSQEGKLWQAAATAFQQASNTPMDKTAAPTPLLEKKWTAIPRLQKKVLELERAASQHQKIHAHRTGSTTDGGTTRRMLPRLPCTHTLQGHSAVVTTVQVHPVFTVVVSGSEDGTIKVWDHESGEYVRTLKGHTNSVTSLAFTPTGTHLASSSTDLSIKLWDFSTYHCIRTLRGHDHTISALSFLPILSQIAVATATGETSSSQTGMDAESAGAQFVVSCSRDKTVKVWDVETGFCEQTINHHNDWVRCIAVRRSDGALCTAGNDSVIFIYNGSDRSKMCELRGHESVIESVAFICEALESSQKAAKPGDERRDLLASGGRDRSVRLWNLRTVSCLATFMVHDNWVRSVLLHPSGNYIISAGDDRTIRVMDIKAQRCLRTLDGAHSHFVSCLSIHPTLPILVSGGVDTTLKCWTLD